MDKRQQMNRDIALTNVHVYLVKKAKVMPRDSMVTMVHYDSYGQLLLAEPVTTVNLGKRWKLDHQRNVRYRFEFFLPL